MGAIESINKMAKRIATNSATVHLVNVKKSTVSMLDANRDQMDKGMLNTGSPIKPDYAPSTQKKKGHVAPNLLDKGSFRNKMFIDVKSVVEVLPSSSDHKTEDLKDKYTPDIFGLTESNANEIVNTKVAAEHSKYLDKEVSRTL